MSRLLLISRSGVTPMSEESRLVKYRVYLDADTRAEAEEEAPDDVEVQVGDNGGFFYDKEPDSDRGQEDIDSDGEGLLDTEGAISGNPDLGPNEEIDNGIEPEAGDVVSYVTEDGHQKGRVERVWSHEYQMEGGDMVDEMLIGGTVVGSDPTGDWDVDTDTGRKIAAAVEGDYFGNTHYEDQYVNTRNIQQNVSDIDNLELLEAALQQEIEGRNSRALAKDALPSRIRALGGDPKDILGPNPDSVPDKRQGTDFEGFDRSAAIDAAQFVAAEGLRDDAVYEEWNGLLDTLTQDELKEGAVNALYEEYESNQWGLPSSTLQWEDGAEALGEDKVERSFSGASRLGLGCLTSRMDDETAREAYEKATRVEDDYPTDMPSEFKAALMTYSSDSDTRQHFYDEFSGSTPASGRAVQRQFEDDFDEYTRSMMSDWTGGSLPSLRAVTQGMFGNTPENTTLYANGYPMSSIEPTDQQESHLRRLKNETQRYYRRQEEDTKTVWRGVDSEVTSHGTLDSYSTERSEAEVFESGRLIEAQLEPDDVLMSKEAAQSNGYSEFPGFEDEKEVIVIGGAFDDSTGGDQ